MNLIIHAPNVHQGGGKTLLIQLVLQVGKSVSCTLLTDTRLHFDPAPEHVRVLSFAPTLSGRWFAEQSLRLLARPGDLVLCMGNLPPLLPCAGQVVVFLQNRYLVDVQPFDGMSMKVRLRIAIERLWLRLRLRQGMKLVVQTPSMQAAAKAALGVSPLVLPFFAHTGPTPHSRLDCLAGFVYPATADKHKNHMNLLAAWKLLHESGVDAELHLTVDANQEVLETISRLQKTGVAIVNHGQLGPRQLSNLYWRCAALIFPSHVESFGLPLLEAQAAGLPVIASERDYVRDVIVPAETFDPHSAVSIARAVRRFLAIPEPDFVPMSPADFLREVLL
ncbi:MAG: glycosyltransferase [Pseudomonadota bacterium]